MKSTDELLAVLNCDITARPAGAPGPDELRPAFRGMMQSPGVLVLAFAPGAADTVAGLAEAERMCCGGMQFEVASAADAVTLTVRGTAQQAEAFAALWK